MKDVSSLVSSSPLEYFQLYCSAVFVNLKTIQLDDFVATLISTHGSRLRRFSIHRLPISLKALYEVCTEFPNLEHLFVVVEQMEPVCPCLKTSLVPFRSVSGAHRILSIESHKTPGDPHQLPACPFGSNRIFACLFLGPVTDREAMQLHGHTDRIR